MTLMELNFTKFFMSSYSVVILKFMLLEIIYIFTKNQKHIFTYITKVSNKVTDFWIKSRNLKNFAFLKFILNTSFEFMWIEGSSFGFTMRFVFFPENTFWYT